jgi:hypothetical protein
VSRPQNQHLNYIMRCITLQQNIVHIHTFLKVSYFQPWRFNRDNTQLRYGIARFYSRLISVFVFDILQIPSGCIQVCGGCVALICTLLVTDLLMLMTSPRRVTRLHGEMQVQTVLRLDIHIRR